MPLLSLVLTAATARAQVDCSSVACSAADQTAIFGYPLFSQANFAPIVDGFGRTRLF